MNGKLSLGPPVALQVSLLTVSQSECTFDPELRKRTFVMTRNRQLSRTVQIAGYVGPVVAAAVYSLILNAVPTQIARPALLVNTQPVSIADAKQPQSTRPRAFSAMVGAAARGKLFTCAVNTNHFVADLSAHLFRRKLTDVDNRTPRAANANIALNRSSRAILPCGCVSTSAGRVPVS
jgi:hypothetical protein